MWIDHHSENDIPHKIVDCFANDVIDQLKGCRALLWQHSESDPREVVIARRILSTLEHTGLRVFPDFRTAWLFDNKVGQKYLFESMDIPPLPAALIAYSPCNFRSLC